MERALEALERSQLKSWARLGSDRIRVARSPE
jgi:hypothetical protein